MEPDQARQFIFDLNRAMHERVREMSDDRFTSPEGQKRLVPMEKQKQYYGSHRWQLLAGIEAALREFDASKHDVEELKDRYDGTFVEGVEIGERLAVYEDRDFTFKASNGDQTDAEDSESKFTFVQ